MSVDPYDMKLTQVMQLNYVALTRQSTILTQQSNIFTQMNSLLRTLNSGFTALTRAIVRNTEVMMKMNISPAGFKVSQQLPSAMKGQTSFNDITAQGFDKFMKAAPIFADIETSAKKFLDDVLGALNQSGNLQTTPISQQDLQDTNIPPPENKEISIIDSLKTLWATPKSYNMQMMNQNRPADQLGSFGKIGLGLKQAGSMMKPFMSALSAMGPQMLGIALVMEPLQAFLGGLMEPFSMITEMFGAFGEILGTSLYPVLQNAIMPLLYAFLPVFTALAQVLAPILQLLFSFTGLGVLIQVITPLMPIITDLINILGQLMTAISPLVTLFTTIISLGIGAILNILSNSFSSLGVNMESITEWINRVASAISVFVTNIQNMFDKLSNFSWNDIGTAITGGGADKYGWW